MSRPTPLDGENHQRREDPAAKQIVISLRGLSTLEPQRRGATVTERKKAASELPRQTLPAMSENEFLEEGRHVSLLIQTPFPQFESDLF